MAADLSLEKPADCQNMTELRAQIDRVDTMLIALLAQRAAYIDRAVELKRNEGLPARIDERIEAVMSRVRVEAVERGLDPTLVGELWHHLIEWSIAREAAQLDA